MLQSYRPNDTLTVMEAAKKCKVNPETVRRWIREEKLPAQKLGQVFYIRSEDVDRYVNDAQ